MSAAIQVKKPNHLSKNYPKYVEMTRNLHLFVVVKSSSS